MVSLSTSECPDFYPAISVTAATVMLERMAAAGILQRAPWDIEPARIDHLAAITFAETRIQTLAAARVKAFHRLMADGRIDDFIRPGVSRRVYTAICAAVALCPLLVDEHATFDPGQFRDQVLLMTVIEGVH